MARKFWRRKCVVGRQVEKKAGGKKVGKVNVWEQERKKRDEKWAKLAALLPEMEALLCFRNPTKHVHSLRGR